MKYKDREEAGKVLAQEILKRSKRLNFSLIDNAIILAIPDEGIIPAYIMAKELNIKMNLIVVGKLKIPGANIGFGSITVDGTKVLNDAMINRYRLTPDKIGEIEKNEINRMVEKIETYDIVQINLENLKDKVVIIVDEGAQTGYSAIAAIKSLNLTDSAPRIISVAIPAASFQSILTINRYSYHLLCPNIVDSLYFEIKDAYSHYHKLSKEDVFNYIDKIKKENLLFV